MSGSIRDRRRCVLEELKLVQTKLNRTTSLKQIETSKPRCVYRSTGNITSHKPLVDISSYKSLTDSSTRKSIGDNNSDKVVVTENIGNDDSSSVSSLSSDSGFHVATPPSSSFTTPEIDEQYHVTSVGDDSGFPNFCENDARSDANGKPIFPVTNLSLSFDGAGQDKTSSKHHQSTAVHRNGNNDNISANKEDQGTPSHFVSTLKSESVTKKKSPPRKRRSASNIGYITPFTRRLSEPTQNTSLFRNKDLWNFPLRHHVSTSKENLNCSVDNTTSRDTDNTATENNNAPRICAQDNFGNEPNVGRNRLTSPTFISNYRSESNLLLSGQLRRSSLQPEKFTFNLSELGKIPENKLTKTDHSVNKDTVHTKRWSVSNCAPKHAIQTNFELRVNSSPVRSVRTNYEPPINSSPARSLSVNDVQEQNGKNAVLKTKSYSFKGPRKRPLSSSSFSSSNSTLLSPPPPLPLPPNVSSVSPSSTRFVSTCQFTFGNKRSKSESYINSTKNEEQKNSISSATNITKSQNCNAESVTCRQDSGVYLNEAKQETEVGITEPEILKTHDENRFSVPMVNISSPPTLSSSSDSSDSGSEYGYDTTDSLTFDSYDVTGSYVDAPESGRSEQLLDNGESSCVLYTIKKVGDTVKTVRQKIRPGTVADMRKLFSKKETENKKRKIRQRSKIPRQSKQDEKCDESKPVLLTYQKRRPLSRLQVPDIQHGVNLNTKPDIESEGVNNEGKGDKNNSNTLCVSVNNNSTTYASTDDKDLLPSNDDHETKISDESEENFKKMAETVLEKWNRIHRVSDDQNGKINGMYDNLTESGNDQKMTDNSTMEESDQPNMTLNRMSDVSVETDKPIVTINNVSDISTQSDQPTVHFDQVSDNFTDNSSDQRTVETIDDNGDCERNYTSCNTGRCESHSSDSEHNDINEETFENGLSDSDVDHDVIQVKAGQADVIYQSKTGLEKIELPTFIDNLIATRKNVFDDNDINSNNTTSLGKRHYHSCENLTSKEFTLSQPEYATMGRRLPFRENGNHVGTWYENAGVLGQNRNSKFNTWTKSGGDMVSGQDKYVMGGSVSFLGDKVENLTSGDGRNESHSRGTETDDLDRNTYLELDNTNYKTSQKGGKYVSKIKVLPVAHNVRRTEEGDVINNMIVRSSVSFDTPGTGNTSTEACHTPGNCDKTDHVMSESPLTDVTDPAQVTKHTCVLTKTDVSYSSASNSEISQKISGENFEGIIREKRHSKVTKMPEKSSGNTNFHETSEFRDGQQITTKYLSASNTNGDVEVDLNANNTGDVNEKTIAMLKQAMVKYNGENSEDILPIINQTVTKLEGGGNLVLTTLTRKVVEEEDEEDSSPIPASPTHVNGNVYYVEDHKGNVYMVEDITDDTQESAYHSSSERYVSDSSIHNTSYDGDYNRIFNLHSVGKAGIDQSTAEEVLLGIYNPENRGSTLTIEEVDEYNRRQQYDNQRALTSYVAPQNNNNQYGYTTDSSNNKESTSYTYEIPGSNKQKSMPYSSSTVKTVKQSYEMTSGNPWGNDADSITSASGATADDEIKMKRQETIATTNIDSSGGCNAMLSSYVYQTDATLMPMPQVPQVIPYTLSPPLLQLPAPPKLVQLDMTPVQDIQLSTSTPIMSTKVTETKQIVTEPEIKEPPLKLSDPGRPVYKSVALVKGPYKTPKWEEMNDEPKKYKVVSSHSSDEIQEKTMSFDESKSMYKVCRSENYGKNAKHLNEHVYDENRNWSMVENPLRTYRSEKVIHVNGSAPQEVKKHKTIVDVSSPKSFENSGIQRSDDAMMTTMEVVENNKTTTTQKFSSETTMPPLDHIPPPNMVDLPSVQRDMRVVRGNILIKNTMEQGLDEFNDNINLFHNGFSMSKQNPLYQSDEDIHKRAEDEIDNRWRNQDQDLTYETMDRYTKTKAVKRDKPKTRHQNLSQLLLSRLSTIDAKDIRQHIDVKHHNEDIYGDIRFQHADGSQTGSGSTNNFDSVGENIDLVMRDGKAFITMTVTAERYTPIDLEFNVWRKSQAIVTRVIEIDFLANEQRRRLYYHVMDKAGMEEEHGRFDHRARGQRMETVLSSKETLDLFSDIMDAADGEGDHEDITVKTRQHRTTLPPSHQDFLY